MCVEQGSVLDEVFMGALFVKYKIGNFSFNFRSFWFFLFSLIFRCHICKLCKDVCMTLKPKHYTFLAGIFHLAGSLADATLPSCTKEDWVKVNNVKISGAFLLDALSRRFCKELHAFVCFSSIVAAFGKI